MINLPQDFPQVDWTAELEAAAQRLIRIALEEDLNGQRDWSTWAAVSSDCPGPARVVARQAGVVCGVKLLPMIQAELAEFLAAGASLADSEAAGVRTEFEGSETGLEDSGGAADLAAGRWRLCVNDGQRVEPGTVLARWQGPAAGLLTMERTVLNFLGRLSGIATLTRYFVDAVVGTGAQIYDTRKTTPGWRSLEKYAVRCGGGRNHRLGLYSAVMLKDNHLASAGRQAIAQPDSLRQTILAARKRLEEARQAGWLSQRLLFQVEVDSLAQLAVVLREEIDLILLDNMTLHDLRQAVTIREASGRPIPLEASGGVTLANVAQIAGTGVDRISVGQLTHSADAWDVGMDWGDA